MNKLVKIYALFIAGLIVSFMCVILFLQSNTTSAQLKKLGTTKSNYSKVKENLLMSSLDPVPDVMKFITKKNTRRSARIEALQILLELSRQRSVPHSMQSFAPLLADTNIELRLAVLKTIAKCGDLPGMQPVVDLFVSATDTTISNACAATLRSGADNLSWTFYHAMQNGNKQKIDSCRKLMDSLPIGRLAFIPLLANYLNDNKQFDSAAYYSKTLGIIPLWVAIGTWDNRRLTGINDVFDPEIVPFDINQIFTLSDSTKAQWSRMDNCNGKDAIDLQSLFIRQLFAVCYLRTWVKSSKDQDALLSIGSDDGVKVWVNDSIVYNHHVSRGIRIDDDMVKIKLKKGINPLIFKISQDVFKWYFICRLTDFTGRAIPDMHYSNTGVFKNDSTKISEAANVTH